jgi:hypothetical protein
LICAFLLSAFVVLSHSAVLTKNATIDEPDQAMSAWLELHQDDFRIQASPPVLWQAWAGLGNLFTNLKLTYNSPIWKNKFWNPEAEILWSTQMLYSTPGNDGDAFVNRDRDMMLLAGLALGALISWWSYQLAGPTAAVVATILFCFDPNFLAHAPLVKGDVAFALVLLSLAFATWRLGQRATPFRVIVVGLLCGTLTDIKFTGFIVGPLLALMMFIRAMLPQPWALGRRILQTRAQRLSAGLLIGIFAVICCFTVTWASYGFRYRVAPSAAVSLDMDKLYTQARTVATRVALNRIPTAAEVAARTPGDLIQFVRWAASRHFLPQAFLAGLLYQLACVRYWPAFLNNEIYSTGHLRYFPLAVLYKTPVAALIAYGLAAVMLVVTMLRRFLRTGSVRDPASPRDAAILLWTVACLVVPFAVFFAALLAAHLNIGLRSALPIFPFIQIGTGCAAAMVWRSRPRLTTLIIIVLSVGLAAESLAAWPNYIAFFNVAVGGERGGFSHLGDSNLDWGQDINSLADWQRQHPGVPIYTRLFYSVDPEFYGLQYHPLKLIPEGPHAGQPPADMPHSVIAVGATHLQGLYLNSWEQPFFQKLRESQPIAVLGGGTIYLYEYRPTAADDHDSTRR